VEFPVVAGIRDRAWRSSSNAPTSSQELWRAFPSRSHEDSQKSGAADVFVIRLEAMSSAGNLT
jgi:hypothetical protein